MPWYSACCPPHFANFRDAVAAAAAEAAAASKSMMRTSAGAAGGSPSSFMQVSCARGMQGYVNVVQEWDGWVVYDVEK